LLSRNRFEPSPFRAIAFFSCEEPFFAILPNVLAVFIHSLKGSSQCRNFGDRGLLHKSVSAYTSPLCSYSRTCPGSVISSSLEPRRRVSELEQ
jgi:hypothetical protein